MPVKEPGLGLARVLCAKGLFWAWDTHPVGRGGVGVYSDHGIIF